MKIATSCFPSCVHDRIWFLRKIKEKCKEKSRGKEKINKIKID